MCSFLTLPILVQSFGKSYHLQLCHLRSRLLSFRQCHRLQPVQHCWFHCLIAYLPFHSSWYSPVADHSCHSSPPIPSCLYSFFTSLLHSPLLCEVKPIIHFLHLFLDQCYCIIIMYLEYTIYVFSVGEDACKECK